MKTKRTFEVVVEMDHDKGDPEAVRARMEEFADRLARSIETTGGSQKFGGYTLKGRLARKGLEPTR